MEINRRYTLMVFPQKCDGSTLNFNIVLIPRNRDPFIPTDTGLPAPLDKTAAFADLKPVFRACVVKGLEEFPLSNATAQERLPVTVPLTVNAASRKLEVLRGIAASFAGKINLTADKAEPTVTEFRSVSKYLPFSYREAFNFTTPRHRNARIDQSYHCAIKDRTPKTIPPTNDAVSWGKIFAHILRQPLLAKACGIVYQASLTYDAAWFAAGGYLYVDLVNPELTPILKASLENPDGPLIKRYAARIPKLEAGEARSLFAPLLFPVLDRKASDAVDPEPPPGEWDQIFAEANEYDDGFAKIVHAMQPVSGSIISEQQDGFHPVKEAGIRLAWDDEQILIWYIRQLAENPAEKGSGRRVDAPLGVFGYRIDVKEDLPGTVWESLNLVQAKAAYKVAGREIGNLPGERWELPYQVYPTQFADNDTYWLPMYYTNWTGHSLVLKDSDAAAVYQNDKATERNSTVSKSVSLEQLFATVAVKAKLFYGRQYQFRVRLADISGGGPAPEAEPVYEAPAGSTQVLFKRYVAPGLLRINNIPDSLPEGKQEFYNEIAAPGPVKTFASHPVLRVQRPLLGYPAVVFTGRYQKAGLDPVALLIKASRDMVGTTAFGIADPDVGKVEVKVEIETLGMDNLLSADGRENYAPLYTTVRTFGKEFDAVLDLQFRFIDAPVLSFDGNRPFGDPHYNQSTLDSLPEIVLPTARRVRVTLRALCDGDGDYFGFINPGNPKLDSRCGKTTQFWFYKESDAETSLLEPNANVPPIQAIYFQPESPPVFDGKISGLFLERQATENRPDIVQRLAAQLGLASKGLTLLGRKGERVVFGCNNRIRHTLAPDHSSITFASREELTRHWLGCLVYKLHRDWSWDALRDVSFRIGRYKKFRKDPDCEAEKLDYLGDIEMKHSASFEALQPDRYGKVNRDSTIIVYIDAIEPKTALLAANGGPRFPDELEVQYSLQAQFKPNHALHVDRLAIDQLLLPVTVAPAQVPKLVSAGIAFSPYVVTAKYSATEPRKRYLWLEFAAPVPNPDDALFCRVLAYAPDQLLSNNHLELLLAPEEPLLGIDSEFIRVITPRQSDDMAGLGAMQAMEQATDSDTHYLVPLPPGMTSESPELFGFFTYEFRIGHGHWAARDHNIWSTAQGRFGRPLRVTGIQHPAPTLLCAVTRDREKIYVNAPFAKAVAQGKDVTSRPPRTKLWCLLYAQVKRADGQAYKNILLDEKPMPCNEQVVTSEKPDRKVSRTSATSSKLQHIPVEADKESNTNRLTGAQLAVFKDQPRTGLAVWETDEVNQRLRLLGLPADASLSVLAVELFGNITRLQDHLTNLEQVPLNHQAAEILTQLGFDLDKPLREAQAQVESLNMKNENMTVQTLQPLGKELGQYRILRTSPLTEVPGICVGRALYTMSNN
jgi:hypothetical protein